MPSYPDSVGLARAHPLTKTQAMGPSRQTWSSYGPPYPLGRSSSVEGGHRLIALMMGFRNPTIHCRNAAMRSAPDAIALSSSGIELSTPSRTFGSTLPPSPLGVFFVCRFGMVSQFSSCLPLYSPPKSRATLVRLRLASILDVRLFPARIIVPNISFPSFFHLRHRSMMCSTVSDTSFPQHGQHFR